MLYVDVFFDGFSIYVPIGNIFVYVENLSVVRASKRPVVFVVPILKLHAVDMATLQEVHFVLNGFIGLFSKIRYKAVSGETFPVARSIYGNG